MKKLKTLKDIQPYNKINARFVNIDSLKQEAIKWVKAGNDETRLTQEELHAINTWIKVFFNITEEDLKI